MPELLALHADERSTYVVNVSFKDEDGTAVAPTSATWTLQDSSGTVINAQQDIAITTPTSSEDIVLSGDDLGYQTTETDEKVLRELTVEFVYDSSLGTDLPGALSVYFWLDRLGRNKI